MNIKDAYAKVEYVIKHNTAIQYIYKKFFSLFFRFVGLFIATDNKLILFTSFGGRKYNDSPKVLFEALRQDSRLGSFRFVWAFQEPNNFKIDGAELITIDSWNYFITALRAKVWITSVNIERGLHFKKSKTIYLNTWHGAGTKKIGNACSGRKDYDFSNVDMMLVQSDFEKEIFLRDFLCNPDAIRKIGFPRNDELFTIKEIQKVDIRKDFHIPVGKKVILYAPTWRDSKDGGLSYDFAPPIHLEKWKEYLGNNYVLLFRMHTFTTTAKIQFDDFVRDVSQYDNLNHILAISDIVITDYSTIVYDAVIANKPFICFGFDYETYQKERGFYYDLDTEYPGGVLKTEDEVLRRIIELSENAEQRDYALFRNKYIEAGGNATHQIIDELADALNL